MFVCVCVCEYVCPYLPFNPPLCGLFPNTDPSRSGAGGGGGDSVGRGGGGGGRGGRGGTHSGSEVAPGARGRGRSMLAMVPRAAMRAGGGDRKSVV